MGKDELKARLREKVCDIEFTKADGSLRLMKATLHESHLPPLDPAKTTTVKKVNEDVKTVYDFEAKGWRSFRWDSLKTVDGEKFTL